MSHNEIKLEVCVDSIASAVAAAEGGASRIELCSALSEGGLTPTVGTLKALKCLPINVPVFCMLRPRAGNDFIYSAIEMNGLLIDMEVLRENGADGFVFGALTPYRLIDLEKCQHIIRNSSDLPVTFHRAFDLTDPSQMHNNVDRIKQIGFKRLLSSGFRQTAAEGSDNLTQLAAKHSDFIIMPGSGINTTNLKELLTVTKCIEFHSSAKLIPKCINKVQSINSEVFMGDQDSEPYNVTNVNVVRQMVAIAQAMTTNSANVAIK